MNALVAWLVVALWVGACSAGAASGPAVTPGSSIVTGSVNRNISDVNANVAAYGYLNVFAGPTIRFNDAGYGLGGLPNLGVYSAGDTNSCAWSNDGDEYCTYNDGIAPNTPVGNTSPGSSNIGISKMTGGVYTTLTGVNPLEMFGAAGQLNSNGWSDGGTWKSSGIAPYNGCLYLTVQRQLNSVSSGFENGSSSIIKSCDHGATWSNYWATTPSSGGNAPSAPSAMWKVGTPNDPTSLVWTAGHAYSPGYQVLDSSGHNQYTAAGGISGSTAPVWNEAGGTTTDGSVRWTDKGPAIAGFVPVTYCQDNTLNCPSTQDGNGQYIYLTALGAGPVNEGSYSNYYLARIAPADFPNLDVTQYQYWTGYPGESFTDPSNWSNTMVGAQPILQVTGIRGQVYYISALSQYVLLNDTFHGEFEVWNAARLAGPWVKSGFITTGEEQGGFPTINMSSVETLSTNPPQARLHIQYSGVSSTAPQGITYPLDESYSTHWRPVTLTGSVTAAVNVTATNYIDNLSKTGLVLDYGFYPELGNTITDYSGAGNTGTAIQQASVAVPGSVSMNYTTNPTLWFNANNPGNDVNTGMFYVTSPLQLSGNEFTLYVVWRKLQQPVSGEGLVSGSGISVTRNGTATDSWNITVNGSTYNFVDATIGGFYDGSWNFLALQYTGSALNIYDYYHAFLGTPAATISVSGSLTPTTPFFVGGGGFSGEMAKLAIYNVAQTNAELQANAVAIYYDMKGRGIYLPRPIQPGEYPLDFQLPLGAWSVRQLLASYTGAAMNVRNGRTGATMDINYTASGDLDSVSLLSFCSGLSTNCYVHKWYDQSGHGYNLVSNQGTDHEALIVYKGGLVSCPANNVTKACVSLDGQEAYVTDPDSNFFFYGFTAAVSGIMSVNQVPSSTFNSFLSLGDGVNPIANDAANASLVQANVNNSALSWYRAGISPLGIPITNLTPFSVFSWYDSYLERFALNGMYMPNVTLGFGAPFVGQTRFQSYLFQVGNSVSGSGTAANISEVILWNYAPAAHAATILGNNQGAYFGTITSW